MGSGVGGFPVVWQQLVQRVHRVIADAFEHVYQVAPGVELGLVAGGDEALQHRCWLAARVAAEEGPVAAVLWTDTGELFFNTRAEGREIPEIRFHNGIWGHVSGPRWHRWTRCGGFLVGTESRRVKRLAIHFLSLTRRWGGPVSGLSELPVVPSDWNQRNPKRAASAGQCGGTAGRGAAVFS